MHSLELAQLLVRTAAQHVCGYFVALAYEVSPNLRGNAGYAADSSIGQIGDDERYVHCCRSQSRIGAVMRSISLSVMAWKDGRVMPREAIDRAWGNSRP